MLKASLLLSPETLAHQALLTSWHQLHQLLVQLVPAGATLANLATYYCCVSEAFARTQDIVRTRELSKQLVAASEQLPADSWTGSQLDQACTLAWLHTRPVTIGPIEPPVAARLVQLDRGLVAQAHDLVGRSDAASRRAFLHILRYLSLRSTIPNVQHDLRALLLSHTRQPVLGRTPEVWSLGLTDGLASELLLLLRLPHLGSVEADIKRYVSEGLVHLLATRRHVDFSEQRYSVFPYQLQGLEQHKVFSAALTWQHGDLGQVLLLYQAQELLQEAELTKIAELVGLNTLLRITPPTTTVTSSKLYEGAAGVAYLYHKLYKVSGQLAYCTGYKFWLSQTQYWLQQEIANGTAYQGEASLLTGLVGVGLVLLSATTAKSLDWDALIL